MFAEDIKDYDTAERALRSANYGSFKKASKRELKHLHEDLEGLPPEDENAPSADDFSSGR